MVHIKRLLLIVACSTLLVACSNKDETKEDIPAKEETPVKEEPKKEEMSYVTPFTGEKVAKEVTMRPVLATINNHTKARPQSGIGKADVIYEMLAEGNITRLLVLFQSEMPDEIGPIRSARDYFIKIAQGLDAFYIAHGYSPEAQKMLNNGQVDHINGIQYDGSLFYRSSDRVAPHNSYIGKSSIEKGAEKVDASLLYQKKVFYSFYTEEESAKIGVDANSIEIAYSNDQSYNSHYTYDDTSKFYTRKSNGVVTTDKLTGEPIQLSNILIFEMKHTIIDNEGRRDIDITSGGNAYVFQQGMMRKVYWKNVDGVLKAVEDDGSEVKLITGQTWIHFVPTSPGIATSVKYTQ